jgi:hypothetical protein
MHACVACGGCVRTVQGRVRAVHHAKRQQRQQEEEQDEVGGKPADDCAREEREEANVERLHQQ